MLNHAKITIVSVKFTRTCSQNSRAHKQMGKPRRFPIRKQIGDSDSEPEWSGNLAGEKQTSAVQLPECGIWRKQRKSFGQTKKARRSVLRLGNVQYIVMPKELFQITLVEIQWSL